MDLYNVNSNSYSFHTYDNVVDAAAAAVVVVVVKYDDDVVVVVVVVVEKDLNKVIQ
jgi:hypothetical protein